MEKLPNDASKAKSMDEPLANNSQPTPKEEDVEKMAEYYAKEFWYEQPESIRRKLALSFRAGYNAAKTTK
jgi:hypothetical protein